VGEREKKEEKVHRQQTISLLLTCALPEERGRDDASNDTMKILFRPCGGAAEASNF